MRTKDIEIGAKYLNKFGEKMTVVGRNWRQGWFECRVEDRVAHVAVYHARAIVKKVAVPALNSTEN